jgi:hypothetical protein
VHLQRISLTHALRRRFKDDSFFHVPDDFPKNHVEGGEGVPKKKKKKVDDSDDEADDGTVAV